LFIALLLLASARGRRRALAVERAALERSERRFRALVDRASEAVIVVDDDNHIADATGAVEAICGRPASALIGTPAVELVESADRARARQLLERVRRDGPSPTPTEWTLERQPGKPGVFEVTSADFTDHPDVAGIVLTIRDVTARHEAEAQLRHQSLHDPLTGLPNRTLFENRVAQAFSRLTRGEDAMAVLYVDVDGFKTVNDSLGHAAGDELLRHLAARIDSALRGGDTAARLGGDEFACLLEGLVDGDEALAIARRLEAAVTPELTIGGRSVSPRASFGIAVTTQPTLDAEALIRNADLAMYQAKEEGRGGIAVFHDDMLLDARLRLDLREDLDHAADREELALAYQPLVDLTTGSMAGVEALLRWHHSAHGFIGPDRFIPLAENTGQIVGLGRWVLEHALADLVTFSKSAPDLRLNVNVAPRELAEPDYVASVAAALARHGIDPHRVTLEITESEFADDGEVIARLHELSALGVTLSIDDFGIGQSSLARLQHLPVEQVKLDRSFLSTIDQRPQQATLVRSMIELGHALGLQMVAEGIERDSQVEMLRTLPCQLGQGYLFGRPQSRAEIVKLVEGPAMVAGPSLS
jgi:diguanylate cyclase (GGDEF)-like protein/PAS domain S-box-containing protein